MRSISALAFDQILNCGKRPLMFIGSAWRRETKPECISPQIERQWARFALSLGNRPAFGAISLRNSPIASVSQKRACCPKTRRSEEHTSELQSHLNLVCRLLLEKKKKKSTSKMR